MPDWSKRLSRPVAIKDGRTIKTLAEAARLALDNKKTGKRETWQHAAKLFMEASEGGNIEAATKQLEFALLMDGNLGFMQPRK